MSSPKPPRGDSDRHVDPSPLVAELAKVLPNNCSFTVHHLSTPPTPTGPLFLPSAYHATSTSKASGDSRAPLRELRPSKLLKTYCEQHFLTVSIAAEQGVPSRGQVIVLGLEIYIYTTTFSTIIFVAKADSTGYLSLLNLPKDSPSPIREVTTCFLAFLVANRKRPAKQLVVNLFARSQSQYLFPGSVKNDGKHVLDDRGLVKWWCRVFNTLLEGDDYSETRRPWDGIHGYLVIPGLDNYETRAFLPRSALAAANWTLGHPLEEISPYTKDPNTFGRHIHPRSLIPTFPDDPKARFVEELEESTSEKIKLASGWKTPKTLEQFWEMMAFRQECSSGRLTGFIWIVFEPQITPKILPIRSATGSLAPNTTSDPPTDGQPPPATSRPSQQNPAKPAREKPRRKRRAKKTLKGPIITRKPQIKTQRAQFPKLTETPYYYWPEKGRGQVVLNDSNYKRAVELLLHLEFGTLNQAIASTARWTNEVNTGENWALEVVGERTVPAPAPSIANGAVNNLSGAVRRKRGSDGDDSKDAISSGGAVNTLGGGLVRKKARLDTCDITETSTETLGHDPPSATMESSSNVLGAGLVRKRPKDV
ncbi:histone acetylation protein-domain-containing protein [Durotheca rogersii]|uniref:histone acetylation protein-domain-containing protein n=1 Tax=Durotheca rogersii TaxID=419775 RepID=UPI00221EDC1B|nr:histone acetylation protein-domain-containing protein [Durotheca rogersii]KAI5862955.1 histone acetylation protein-domain-containing protein [Durotheca rogersii]